MDYNPSIRQKFGEFPVDIPKMHKDNRGRLLKKLKEPPFNVSSGIVFLKGGISTTRYDTDYEHLFRQESNFQYLFGVSEPDCFAAIDVTTGRTIVFIPRLPVEYAVWMGEIQSLDSFKRKYGTDDVYYTDEAEGILRNLNPDRIHLIDSVPNLPDWLNHFQTDKSQLKDALGEARLIKSQDEIALMRYINKISSYAHCEVMKAARPGMKQYELEAIFLHLIYTNGRCRFTAYTCICGTGKHAGYLHYPDNDKEIADNHICLLDMGAEYHCYTSDITCSFPASGKFSQDQKEIYETVLAAQQAVMKAMKPGVQWEDMHRLAERVIAEELLKHGFLKGTVQELIDNHIPALFFPHGLGHQLGLDTHDVGGYPRGVERLTDPGIKYLRTRRELEVGMVVTVEPGVYFIEANLLPASRDPKISKFLNLEKIERFMNFGGVRLEDDVVVTEDGIENLTQCPRTVEEVEELMQKKTSTKFNF